MKGYLNFTSGSDLVSIGDVTIKSKFMMQEVSYCSEIHSLARMELEKL